MASYFMSLPPQALRLSCFSRLEHRKTFKGKLTPRASKFNKDRCDGFSNTINQLLANPSAEALQPPKKCGAGTRYSVSPTARTPTRIKDAWGDRDPAATEPPVREQSGRRSRSRKEAVPRVAALKVERCSRCTMDEMWKAYDVFRSLDKRSQTKISRQDFCKALQDYPTLDRLRVMRKSNIEGRFRENTQDVSLEEFLLLLWPASTKEDMQQMVRWGQLREAQAVLHDGTFRGETSELRKIFDLLDENGDHMLSVSELQRARIFNAQEIQMILRTDRTDTKLSFNDFCHYAQNHLKKMYITEETQKQMKEEVMQSQAEEFQSSFRTTFSRK